MSTKLSVFCDKVIEAGWLAAVVVVPLFFNPYSYRSFEPDKITLLRSIALLMLLAWIVKILDTGYSMKSAGKRGLVSTVQALASSNHSIISVLVLAGIYILATVTSIVPHISLWGSYQRLQGTYSTLCYIIVFFLTLHLLRTRWQLARLITGILLSSLPISLYGIMQHYGLDPITWGNVGDEVSYRVISTMGNPIFLAAYLIMVVPLTIMRLIHLLPTVLNKRSASHYLLAGCYIFLLAAQLLCICFTQSRGPLLGLMVGMLFLFLLLGASKGDKRLALIIVGVAIVLILFLAVPNLLNTPLELIGRPLYPRGLSKVLDVGSRTAQQRILAWEGTIKLATADPVRTLIGYGPESMLVTFPSYFPPELASLVGNVTFDRAHNETLDALATTGLLGVAAYLLLFGSLFYYSLKYLGLVEHSRDRKVLITLCVAGGFIGTVLPWLLEGQWRFAGVGLPAGVVIALGVYLVMYTFRKGETKLHPNSILLIALLSAMVAHFIEIQFGIAIAATRTYFWVYAALTLIVGRSFRKGPAVEYASGALHSIQALRKRHSGRGRGQGGEAQVVLSEDPSIRYTSLMLYSLIIGLILATLGFAFIGSPVNVPGRRTTILALLFTVWFICSVITMAESTKGTHPRGDSAEGSYLIYPVLSLAVLLFFVGAMALATQLSAAMAKTIVIYYLYVFLVLVTLAIATTREIYLPTYWYRAKGWVYLLLTMGTIVFVFVTNIKPIMADIYYKQGMSYANAGQWDESITLFQQALSLAPSQDFYHVFLGGAYIEKAKTASDAAQMAAWLEESRRTLVRGKVLSPLNPDYTAKLGLLHWAWGEMVADPKERAEKLDKALEYYQQAAALSPQSVQILAQWGSVYYTLGQYDKAIEKYQRALTLNGKLAETHLLLGDAYIAIGDWDQAAKAYKRAIELDPEGALQEKLRAVEGAPAKVANRQSLALLYEQLGQRNEALAELHAALDFALPEEKPLLEALIAQLEAERR